MLLFAAVMSVWAAGGAAASGRPPGRNATVKPQIAAGWEHTVVLKGDGTLWAWGRNTYGQLGYDTTTDADTGYTDISRIPQRIGADDDWVAVTSGMDHSLAVKSDGSLYAWGYNHNGQLGDNSTTDRAVPVRVGSDNDWVAVSAGEHHTVALKSDGSLYAWGANGLGALGDGTTTSSLVPIRIGTDNDWVAVACGDSTTFAVKSDGSLWSWGSNLFHELGYDTTTDADTGYNDRSRFPQRIGTANDWTAVISRGYAVRAVKSDGSLYAWGINPGGELGDGTTTTRLTPTHIGSDNDWVVATGGWNDWSMGLKSDGSLWAWGWNGYGLFGNGTYTDSLVPIRVGSGNDWVAVSCGNWHTVALRSDGTIWTWGVNNDGQLGDGTTTWRATPLEVLQIGCHPRVAVGEYHTAAIKGDGSLWTWGKNDHGQRGDGDPAWRNAPARIGSANDWVAVACGTSHTVALKSDGSLYAWGLNYYGEVGDGTTDDKYAPTRIGTANDWTAIACGSMHTVALKSDGSLYAWGQNAVGQLGDGTNDDRHTPTRVGTANDWVAVACGSYHTLALKSDGSLWAWGHNHYGELGNGTTDDSNAPTRIGTANDWTAIAGGYDHTAALKSDGSLWTWGDNYYGPLGDGTLTNETAPMHVGATNDWTTVAAGAGHTLAIRSNGSLYAWGFNEYGELGYDTTTDADTGYADRSRIIQQVGNADDWVLVANYRRHSAGVGSDGMIHAWGLNFYGEVGCGTWDYSLPAPVAVAAFGDLAPPTIDTLTSSTHPDQDAWYANDSPALAWTASDASGITGYSYVLDQVPDTVPDTTSEGTATSTSFSGKAEGVWYFHVRARDLGYNWGDTSHYSIRIDLAPPTGSFTVNDDTGYVNSRVVTLHPSASDLHGPIELQVRNAGAAWPGSWQALSADVPWTLTLFEGEKTVEMRFRDAAGNISDTATQTVVVESTPPTGWITIADGAYAIDTHSTTVETWANDLNGGVVMRLRNGGEPWPSSWVAAGGTVPVTLPSGEGTKIIQAQFKDLAGNITLVQDEVLVDTIAPVGSMSIVGDQPYTTTPDVTLALSASDANKVDAFRLRQDGASWSSWQDMVESQPVTLTGADGERTLEVQYRDIAGNTSDVVPDTIVLDRVAPSTGDNTSGGAWQAGPFTLHLTPSDATSGMSGGAAATEYSTDGGTSWQTGLTRTYEVWKRGGGSDSFEVLVRSTDAAGNTETPHAVSVKVDAVVPYTTDDAPSGAHNHDVTVHFSAGDSMSGVGETWYRLDGGPWTKGTQVTVTAAGNDGTHWIHYYSVDNCGNQETREHRCSVTIDNGGGGSLAPAVTPSPGPSAAAPQRAPRMVKRHPPFRHQRR